MKVLICPTHFDSNPPPSKPNNVFDTLSHAGMLDSVQAMGHGMWVEWISQAAKKELTEGIKSLEKEAFWRGSDELARRWEEVDVPLESENGEVSARAEAFRGFVAACCGIYIYIYIYI